MSTKCRLCKMSRDPGWWRVREARVQASCGQRRWQILEWYQVSALKLGILCKQCIFRLSSSTPTNFHKSWSFYDLYRFYDMKFFYPFISVSLIIFHKNPHFLLQFLLNPILVGIIFNNFQRTPEPFRLTLVLWARSWVNIEFA